MMNNNPVCAEQSFREQQEVTVTHMLGRGIFSCSGGKDNSAIFCPAADALKIKLCEFMSRAATLSTSCRSHVDDCCRDGGLLISVLAAESRRRRGDGVTVSVRVYCSLQEEEGV